MTKHLPAGLKGRPSGKSNDATKGSSNVSGGPPEKLLSCPVRDGDPRHYANVTRQCKASQTFRDVSKLNEHLERYHSPFRRCLECWKDFPTPARSGLERAMREHRKECLGIKPDEEERSKRRTVITEAQYQQVRNWTQKLKENSKGGNGDRAIDRHYKIIYDIINPEGTPAPDARITQPTLSQASSFPHVPSPHGVPSGQLPLQKQMARIAEPDAGYSGIGPLPSFVFSGCGDTDNPNYYPYSDEPWNPWIGHDHVALVEKVATTHPYSLDHRVSAGLRQYAISQPFFSPASSGPPSMAHSDGSASTGVIPPPPTIPSYAQGYGIAKPEDEIMHTGSMNDQVLSVCEVYGEDDGEYEPENISLDEYAGPSLGFVPPCLQFS
ncbi:hypothetical protein QBC34DRAFT_108228 [Podospora aff. communis PSN243]|uniref:C2H2-type domain-containing protein n=1 Tax=Podospora aff. communis PSN243 TaxID=3040156 RepID=A0AAV9H7U1_9PEZI|nr:hypothetical protein QBC34DRAFT_108228 [Podospora aff. communis PSN243]